MILLTLMASAMLAGLSGWWLLSAADEAVESDWAFVLAGKPFRALEAADLYNDGLVKKVYVSKPYRSMSRTKFEKMGIEVPRSEWLTQQVLLKSGVAIEDVHFFGTNSLSTVEEILTIKKMLKNNDISFMVITSPTHVRRTKIIMDDHLSGYDYKIVSNKHEKMTSPWWSNQSTAVQVVLEVSKIVFYSFGGVFLSDNLSNRS